MAFPASIPHTTQGPFLPPWSCGSYLFLSPSSKYHPGPGTGFVWHQRVFVSYGSGHLCCAHTKPHDVQGLPFSASLFCPCSWRPCCSMPSLEALQLRPTFTASGETWSLRVHPFYLPSHIGGVSCRGLNPAGMPCPSPGDLPDQGIEPRSPTMQVDSSSFSYLVSPISSKRTC